MDGARSARTLILNPLRLSWGVIWHQATSMHTDRLLGAHERTIAYFDNVLKSNKELGRVGR